MPSFCRGFLFHISLISNYEHLTASKGGKDRNEAKWNPSKTNLLLWLVDYNRKFVDIEMGRRFTEGYHKRRRFLSLNAAAAMKLRTSEHSLRSERNHKIYSLYDLRSSVPPLSVFLYIVWYCMVWYSMVWYSIECGGYLQTLPGSGNGKIMGIGNDLSARFFNIFSQLMSSQNASFCRCKK